MNHSKFRLLCTVMPGRLDLIGEKKPGNTRSFATFTQASRLRLLIGHNILFFS